MTDRELLEAAARAAGIDGAWDFYACNEDGCFVTADGYCWIPIDDDGDALRLAVKKRLEVMCFEGGCSVSTTTDDEPFGILLAEERNDDENAAARRAIVRAAAAMAPKAET